MGISSEGPLCTISVHSSNEDTPNMCGKELEILRPAGSLSWCVETSAELFTDKKKLKNKPSRTRKHSEHDDSHSLLIPGASAEDRLQLLYVKTQPGKTVVVNQICITVAAPPFFPIRVCVYWRRFWEASPLLVSGESLLIGFDSHCTEGQSCLIDPPLKFRGAMYGAMYVGICSDGPLCTISVSTSNEDRSNLSGEDLGKLRPVGSLSWYIETSTELSTVRQQLRNRDLNLRKTDGIDSYPSFIPGVSSEDRFQLIRLDKALFATYVSRVYIVVNASPPFPIKVGLFTSAASPYFGPPEYNLENESLLMGFNTKCREIQSCLVNPPLEIPTNTSSEMFFGIFSKGGLKTSLLGSAKEEYFCGEALNHLERVHQMPSWWMGICSINLPPICVPSSEDRIQLLHMKSEPFKTLIVHQNFYHSGLCPSLPNKHRHILQNF